MAWRLCTPIQELASTMSWVRCVTSSVHGEASREEEEGKSNFGSHSRQITASAKELARPLLFDRNLCAAGMAPRFLADTRDPSMVC